MKNIILSASLMCADFKHLERDLKILKEEGIDFIHVDIMDGHFVPNIALSPLIIESIKEVTDLPFDAHLMVENPDLIIDKLTEIEVESITLHIETIKKYAFRIIKKIKSQNIKVGIAINPATSLCELEYLYPVVDKITVMTVDPGFSGQEFIPEVVPKIKRLSNIKKEGDYKFIIETDGAIGKERALEVIKNGAQMLTLGTSWLFKKSSNLRTQIREIRECIKSIY